MIYIFPLQASAQAFSDAVDALFGYPLPGVNAGDGMHVSAMQGRTMRRSFIVPNQTLPLWAYYGDALVDQAVTALAATLFPLVIPVGVATLDVTWAAPTPTVAQVVQQVGL